jgi:hypothetical protein
MSTLSSHSNSLALALPTELWLEIFHWATAIAEHLYATAYDPFQPTFAKANEQRLLALQMKHSMSLVCRSWHQLLEPMMHQELYVGKDDLSRSKDAQLFERTRRCILPYSRSATPTYDKTELRNSVAVLEACARLDVFVRPSHICRNPASFQSTPSFDFAADDFDCASAFKHLKRLDWWHLDPAHASGGINSLEHVISCATELEYLTIGGLISSFTLSTRPWSLPKLNTLRLSRVNERFLWSVRRWDLPSLKHLIVETIPNERALVTSIWPNFGSTLTTVELGPDLCFFMADQISPLLAGCPNLQELAYHVNFCLPPAGVSAMAEERASLARVRLHALPNDLISQVFWRHLSAHMEALASSSLPALRDVILHGDWSEIVQDARFEAAAAPLRAKKCTISSSHGTVY